MQMLNQAQSDETAGSVTSLISNYRSLLALYRDDPAKVNLDQLNLSTNLMSALYARDRTPRISFEVAALIRHGAGLGISAAKSVSLTLDRWSKDQPPAIHSLTSIEEMKAALQVLERAKAPWLITYMMAVAVDSTVDKAVRVTAKKIAEKRVRDLRSLFVAAAEVAVSHDPIATLLITLDLLKKRHSIDLTDAEVVTENLIVTICEIAKRSNLLTSAQIVEVQSAITRLLAEISALDPGSTITLPFMRATILAITLVEKPKKEALMAQSEIINRLWSVGRRCLEVVSASQKEAISTTLEWFTTQLDIPRHIEKTFPNDDFKTALTRTSVLRSRENVSAEADKRIAIAEMLRTLVGLKRENSSAVSPEILALCELTAKKNGVFFDGVPGELLLYDPLSHFPTSALPPGTTQVRVVTPAIHIHHDDGVTQIYVKTLVESA
jgi:hypothetical protein